MIDVTTDLDHFKDENITITKELKNMQDLRVAEAEFSRTFTIPVSPRNNRQLFNYAYLDSDEVDFDPHKSIDAYWTIDTLLRFVGVLEVNGVVHKKGEPYAYKITFYGRQRGLASIFGEDMLKDIDWSAYNHSLTLSNIKDSWDENLLSGNIHYPWISTVRDWLFATTINDENNIEVNGIVVDEFRPAIKLSEMIEAIFDHYNLDVFGAHDTHPVFNKLYVQPNNREGKINNLVNNSENVVEAQGGNFTVTSTYQTIPMTEVTDEANHWNDSTDTFTAFANGSYQIIFFGLLFSSFNPPATYTIALFVNGVAVDEREFIVTFTGTDVLETFDIVLEDGDEVQLRAKVVSGSANEEMDFTYFFCGNFPTNLWNQTINIGDNMPDMKVVDFVKGFLEAFNLIILPRGEDRYEIEAYVDWIDQGVDRDWRQYIDLENIVYDKPLVYKKVNISHKSTEARAAVVFEQAAGRAYGSVEFLPDIDFGSDQLKIESIFTVYPPSLMARFNEEGQQVSPMGINCWRALDREGEPVKDDFRLYYAIGVGTSSVPYKIQNGLTSLNQPTFTTESQYPIIGCENELPPDNTTESCLFSVENPIIGSPALVTAYSEFWRDYLYSLYDARTRVAQVEFQLPLSEYLQFEMNDTIFCEGVKWTVDSITYNFNTRRARAVLRTRVVTLGKKKSPTVVLPNGRATFTDTPKTVTLREFNLTESNGGYYIPRVKIGDSPFTKLNFNVKKIEEVGTGLGPFIKRAT